MKRTPQASPKMIRTLVAFATITVKLDTVANKGPNIDPCEPPQKYIGTHIVRIKSVVAEVSIAKLPVTPTLLKNRKRNKPTRRSRTNIIPCQAKGPLTLGGT